MRVFSHTMKKISVILMPQDLDPKEVQLSDNIKTNFHEEDFIEAPKVYDTTGPMCDRLAHLMPINETRIPCTDRGAPNEIPH